MYIQQKGPHRDLKKIKPDEEGWVCSDTYRLSYSMDQTTNAHIVLEILPYKSNMIKALVEEGLINNEEETLKEHPLNLDEKVMNIQNFFPNGIPPKSTRQGVGSRVMDDIVLRDCQEYNAKMITCYTEKKDMQGFLKKNGFYGGFNVPFFSLEAYYKLL